MKKILDFLEFEIEGNNINVYETRDYDLEDRYTKGEFKAFIDKLVGIHNKLK